MKMIEALTFRQMTGVLFVCVVMMGRISEASKDEGEPSGYKNTETRLDVSLEGGKHLPETANKTRDNKDTNAQQIYSSNKTQLRSLVDLIQKNPSENETSETIATDEKNKGHILSIILQSKGVLNVTEIDEESDSRIESAMPPPESTATKDESNRSKRASDDCLIRNTSTCPWTYDDQHHAVCLQTKPISCDHDYCLLRCELLKDYNRVPIACIAVRPCIRQAAGEVVHTSQCK